MQGLTYHGHLFLPVTLSFPTGTECSIWYNVISLHLMKFSSKGTLLHPQAPSKVLNLSPNLEERVKLPTNRFRLKCNTLRLPLCCHSLLDPGCVVRASRLDDLWSWGARLFILVAVIRGRAVAALILTDMDDHTGRSGCGGVELILLP